MSVMGAWRNHLHLNYAEASTVRVILPRNSLEAHDSSKPDFGT